MSNNDETMVNYTEFSNLGDFLSNSTLDILTSKDKIKGIADQISANWKGSDSEQFVSKLNEYVAQLGIVNEATNKSSAFLYNSLDSYTQNENEYVEKINSISA